MFLPLSEQSYPPIPSFRDISRFLPNYTRRRRSCPYLVDRKEETVFLDSSSPSDRHDKGFDATTDATMASSPTLVVSRIRRDPWTKEQVEGGWSRDRGIISRRLRYRLEVEESKSSSIVALNRGENSIVPCTGEPFAYHDDTYVTLGVS